MKGLCGIAVEVIPLLWYPVFIETQEMQMALTLDFTARDAEIRTIRARLAIETDRAVRASLVARLFEIR